MSSSSRRVAIAWVVAAALLVPDPCQAWGQQGHRIVARIATKHLRPLTRDKLSAILGVSNAALENAMANAAIWPDLIDRPATGTDRWHYINVPIAAPFSIAGHCPADDCVIAQIEQMRNRLRQNLPGFRLLAAPRPARPPTSQLLAFLVHFVGDLHQPLHAAVNGDRGGGCIDLTTPLTHPGTRIPETANVHIAWDVDTVLAAMTRHSNNERATATALSARSTQGPPIVQGTPADWARESSDLARTLIYQRFMIALHSAPPGACAAGITPVTISTAYLQEMIPVVERRLMEAGVRLANVLNDICGGMGCRATFDL
jgi:hypothetical protein